MINETQKDADKRMHKCIDALKNELSKLRTGRAHPDLLDHIRVPYYGHDTPLSQVASISVSDSRTLTVTPWEKNMVAPIEKAIRTSELGLNPATSGDTVRVPLPPLTEERRKNLIKLVRQEAENARIAIRNVRRDANSRLKVLLKEKQISEDEEHRGQDVMQKLTDKFIGIADDTASTKEAELMEI